MSNKLRALGLILFATFAMSVAATGVASAEEGTEEKFHSEVDHTILDVFQESEVQLFSTGEGEVTCTEVSATQTIEGKTTESITVVPEYGGHCTVSGPPGTFPAHIEFTECDYDFTSTKVGNHSPVHVNCPEEQEIHVKATFLGFKIQCITIPGQEPTGGGVTYKAGEPTEGKKTITVEATVEGIEYTTHKNCGGSGEPYEVLNNATYTGDATVWGTDTDGNKVDIWWQ